MTLESSLTSNGFFRVCQSGGVRAKAGFLVVLKNFEIKKKPFSVVVCFFIEITNRFHVAVGLFSNRSQKASKCGKNISDTLGYRLVCHFLFLPHFDVICDLVLNRRTATWNLFVK